MKLHFNDQQKVYPCGYKYGNEAYMNGWRFNWLRFDSLVNMLRYGSWDKLK